MLVCMSAGIREIAQYDQTFIVRPSTLNQPGIAIKHSTVKMDESEALVILVNESNNLFDD